MPLPIVPKIMPATRALIQRSIASVNRACSAGVHSRAALSAGGEGGLGRSSGGGGMGGWVGRPGPRHCHVWGCYSHE